MLLPIMASTEDAIQVVSFLKTKVTGCTIEDAKAIINKKLLDPRKINAYVIWNLIKRDGDKIKLSELGKKLSRISEAEYSDIFKQILRSIEPYHCALEWMFFKEQLSSVTNIEIASFWYDNKKFSLDGENENTLKDMAVCFFKVCEIVGIGKFVVGRRGQATRLEINRDALGQYVGGSTLSKTSNDNEAIDIDNDGVEDKDEEVFYESDANIDVGSKDEMPRIFIAHGRNMDIVEQIKVLIELANLDFEVAEETETSAIPVPEKVFSAMRRCNSAVICVSVDEEDKKEDGKYSINQNVLIEIGSAFVLYDKKVILVWDTRIDIPSNLQGLYRCEFTGNELSWGTGIKLMKALNEFKKK